MAVPDEPDQGRHRVTAGQRDHPQGGRAAWFDNWQVYAKTKHVNYAYKWLNFVTSPKVQALIADWFGEAPANLKACDSR